MDYFCNDLNDFVLFFFFHVHYEIKRKAAARAYTALLRFNRCLRSVYEPADLVSTAADRIAMGASFALESEPTFAEEAVPLSVP